MGKSFPYANRPFRPCVGIILINTKKQVFVGQRFDNHGEAWQMPQGGIDDGETPVEAAYREMHEEIGTNAAELIREHPEWLSYTIPETLADQLWQGRYRGQTQKWLAFHFTGSNTDINIRTDEPEFREWRWTSVDNLPHLAVPFKKPVYAKLVIDFGDLFLGR